MSCVVPARAGLLAALLLAACSESSAPPPPPPNLDDAGGADGAMDGSGSGDRDGDGLCDESEGRRGTDPDDPDTDGDGYNDFTEALAQMDPLDPGVPLASSVVFLTESSIDEALMVVTETVEAQGEDYEGRFAERSVPGWSAHAGDFFVSDQALTANPEGNVAWVEPGEPLFRGVIGETTLFFELRFRFGANMVRDCIHPYPFRYEVRRGDGSQLSPHPLLLMVMPPGVELTAEGYCPRPIACL